MFCSTYLNASISQTKLKQLRPTSLPHPADSARKEIIRGRGVRKVEVFLHHRGQGQSFPIGSPTGPTLGYCLETQTKVPASPD